MSTVTERLYGHEWQVRYGVLVCIHCGTTGVGRVDPRCRRPELTGVERRALERLKWRIRRGETNE